MNHIACLIEVIRVTSHLFENVSSVIAVFIHMPDVGDLGLCCCVCVMSVEH